MAAASSIALASRPAARVQLVAGRLCLDFVNSVGARRMGRHGVQTIRDEKLTEYFDLLAWAWHAGALSLTEATRLSHTVRRRPAAALKAFARAIRLREALYGILISSIAVKRPEGRCLEVLNAELHRARAAERLVWRGGAAKWRWTEDCADLNRLVYLVAQSAEEMLAHANLSRVRKCGGDDCGWLFEDTSRNRARRWCDMRDCGNVAKVRRFRARQSRT